MPEKGFRPEVFLRFKYFSKNVPLSDGAVSHNVLYNQQLSVARYQIIFYADIILSNYQTGPVPQILKLQELMSTFSFES